MTLPSSTSYLKWMISFVCFEVVSWFAYAGPRSEQIVASLVLAILVWLAWKRPIWLVYASVAELVVGSKGYLLYLTVGSTTVSLRMMVFVLLITATLFQVKKSWREFRSTVASRPLVLLMTWLAISVLIGIIRQNSFRDVYTDANAFLFLGLLPSWWIFIRRDPVWRQRILAIILAGASVIGVKSWLMVLLFGQDIDTIRHVYTWIRNTGVGEITYINTNMYRVFFQSQIYSVLALCVTLYVWLRHHPPRWWFIPMSLSGLGVYISLSRSFWLGLSVAFVLLILWFLRQASWQALTKLWVIVPIAVFAWAMMVWALSFPAFSLSGGRANAVVSRLNGTGSADAATARSNQIKPLLTAISAHPVIGSGFGTTVTYFSTDPRTRGEKTTTAFELGCLDLLLKLGLVGTVLYAVWVGSLWRRIARTPWAGMFLLSGGALVVIHLTTPYLNHPLGLGWLMLTALYAYDAG